MHLAFTTEQEDLSRTLRAFARKELAPRSAHWDRTGEFPRDAWRRMGELGLLGLRTPAAYGGQDADYMTFGIAMQEIGRGDFACTYGIQLAGLAASGVYRGVWRYTSLPDLVRIVRGVTWGTVASVVYLVFVTRFRGLSRAVFVLDWLLLIVLLAASRLSFRLLDEVLRGARPGARPVLIYGAGDGGELALRELRNNSDLGREAVGFLDDDRNKVRTRIHGVPVLGGLDGLEDILETQGVQEVVVATRKISGERLRRLRDTCSAHGVAVTRAAVRLE